MFALEPFEARDWKDVEDAVDDQTFEKIYLFLIPMSFAFRHMEQLPPNDPGREMLTVDNLSRLFAIFELMSTKETRTIWKMPGNIFCDAHFIFDLCKVLLRV